MILTIDNITKEYKDVVAVDNFYAELNEGVYGLLGPNGSGKTTLMRIMADILKPTEGIILYDGCDISSIGDDYRGVLGYLPQNFGFYKNFSAWMFLMYIASLKGIDKSQAKKRVNELLDIVNLSDDRDRKVGTFSGGMKQRLGIAQALLNDPKVLILDEPTSGLDPRERIRFRNMISQISGDRIVILSTHIVSDIEYIAKEVMLIKNGQLVKKDMPDNILNEMSGRVWSAMVPEDALLKLQEKYRIGNIIRRIDGIEVRIISDEKPLLNSVPESPRLEDMYLYYFDEEV